MNKISPIYKIIITEQNHNRFKSQSFILPSLEYLKDYEQTINCNDNSTWILSIYKTNQIYLRYLASLKCVSLNVPSVYLLASLTATVNTFSTKQIRLRDYFTTNDCKFFERSLLTTKDIVKLENPNDIKLKIDIESANVLSFFTDASLLVDIKKLYQLSEFYDFTVKVENEEFKIHKCLF